MQKGIPRKKHLEKTPSFPPFLGDLFIGQSERIIGQLISTPFVGNQAEMRKQTPEDLNGVAPRKLVEMRPQAFFKKTNRGKFLEQMEVREPKLVVVLLVSLRRRLKLSIPKKKTHSYARTSASICHAQEPFVGILDMQMHMSTRYIEHSTWLTHNGGSLVSHMWEPPPLFWP